MPPWRVDLLAKKSRWRAGTVDNFGKLMLLDPHRNTVVAGERFDLEPEEIIAFCEKYRAR